MLHHGSNGSNTARVKEFRRSTLQKGLNVAKEANFDGTAECHGLVPWYFTLFFWEAG